MKANKLSVFVLIVTSVAATLVFGFAETSRADMIYFLSQDPTTVLDIDSGYITDTSVPDLHFNIWDQVIYEGFEQTVVGSELVNYVAGTSDLIYTNPDDQLLPGTKLSDIEQTGIAYGNYRYYIFSATVEAAAVPEPSTLLLAMMGFAMLMFRKKR